MSSPTFAWLFEKLSCYSNRIWRANGFHRNLWVKDQLDRVVPGARILDAGCGGQPFREYCHHLKYVSQDFGALDAADHIIGHAYGPIDYLCDIASIPVESESFDAVLCTEVFEHVPEPILALKEFSRILKPNGMLILTAPLASFVHQEPYHFYGGYSSYWYDRFLKAEGFELLSIEQNGGFFRFFGQECQRFVRVLFRDRSPLKRVILLPLEIGCWLAFSVVIPFLCYWLDKLISTPGTTIGYHVLARRK